MSLRLVARSAEGPRRRRRANRNAGDAQAGPLTVIDCRPDLFERLRANSSPPRRRQHILAALAWLLGGKGRGGRPRTDR